MLIGTAASALDGFLTRVLRHSKLTDNERSAILGLPGEVQQYRGGQDIVSPGQTVNHACLIGGGLAGRFDQMRDGKRQITALHIPGDMCDLHSVVRPTAGWGIWSLTQTTVVHVPHSGLRDVARDHPAIALAFWRDGTLDAAILSKWTGNIGRRRARARLAHFLCETSIRLELAGLGKRTNFALDLSQEQMADVTGLTAVHVNRTLQCLREEGAIETCSRTFIIRDWERLAGIAEFDPEYLAVRPVR